MSLALIAAVVVHFLVAGFHGLAHQLVPVPLAPWQMAFVALVIVAAPPAGAWLVRQPASRVLGAAVVTLSMAASLAFGIVHHFVLVSPDNVWCVPDGPWQASFVRSAWAVAATEVAGTVAGALAWYRWRR